MCTGSLAVVEAMVVVSASRVQVKHPLRYFGSVTNLRTERGLQSEIGNRAPEDDTKLWHARQMALLTAKKLPGSSLPRMGSHVNFCAMLLL